MPGYGALFGEGFTVNVGTKHSFIVRYGRTRTKNSRTCRYKPTASRSCLATRGIRSSTACTRSARCVERLVEGERVDLQAVIVAGSVATVYFLVAVLFLPISATAAKLMLIPGTQLTLSCDKAS